MWLETPDSEPNVFHSPGLKGKGHRLGQVSRLISGPFRELLSQGGLCLSHKASRLGAESLLKASEKLHRVSVPENDVTSVGDTNLGAAAAESDSRCHCWEHGSSSCRFTHGFLSCMN